jgi:MYXO-CTERM domain-containing protein
VFVVADDVVAPSAPFAALTVDDLDLIALRTTGYSGAVSAAVAQHGNHAFVLEGVWSSGALANAQIPSLKAFIASTQILTRLSSVVPAAGLDTDVVFDQPFSDPVPRVRVVEQVAAPGYGPGFGHGFGLLAIAAVGFRRRRRR